MGLPIYNLEGKNTGELKVSEEIFGLKPNISVVHQAMKWYLASARQGTASTKTKGEVSGGGSKPWRQKGTGRARAGSIRSPLWKGGGVIFGPKPRDYSYQLPRKIRELAIKVVLSGKLRENKIAVVEDFGIREGKTKEIAKTLEKLEVENGLLVIDKEDQKTMRAARNLAGFKLVLGQNLNIHDLLKYDRLVMTKDAVKTIEERFLQ